MGLIFKILNFKKQQKQIKNTNKNLELMNQSTLFIPNLF